MRPRPANSMSRKLLPLFALLAVWPPWARGADDNAACLECHADPSLSYDLGGGQTLPLSVDRSVFERSVHGEQGLSCTDCHPGKTPDHATGSLAAVNRHELARLSSQVCKNCHDGQVA